MFYMEKTRSEDYSIFVKHVLKKNRRTVLFDDLISPKSYLQSQKPVRYLSYCKALFWTAVEPKDMAHSCGQREEILTTTDYLQRSKDIWTL